VPDQTPAALRDRFRALHESGTFVIPNPFDVGSARLLEHLGFVALATTSSGFAATLGRPDQHVTRDELVAHVAAICAAVDIPVNVDAEACYAHDDGGITQTIELLAEAGAAGISLEDYDPTLGAILPVDDAAERVAAAVEASRGRGIVLTARAEQLLYGSSDLDEVIARLIAYRNAGAEVVYAPGLIHIDDIRRVVDAVGVAVNVLALPGTPSVPALADAGVRRVSTGGALTWAAYGGLVAAATELRDHGTSGYLASVVSRSARRAAFGQE
jgi:2-methylisocitrate lyase-like PEP mutase family enzyme